MGQIKKLRKKYSTPTHPWQRDRILEEKGFIKEYGLKNKKEIWKTLSKLKNAAEQAKKIIANKDLPQYQKEQKQLFDKLLKYNLIAKDAKVEDILVIDPKQIFERRIQTIIFRKGLARSVKQARQFIVHGHVTIDGQKINVPSYLVPKDKESQIAIKPTSKLASPEHPERISKEIKEAKQLKEKMSNVEEQIQEKPAEVATSNG